MKVLSGVTTFLFTDIEGSTRLWDQEHERMQVALARHDAIVRAAVEDNRGVVVKMSGDGAHGAFDDPLDALGASLQLQQALVDPAATHGVFHRDPADNAFLAPLMPKTRAALGSAAFDAAEGNGRALSYEAAIAGARAWLESA